MPLGLLLASCATSGLDPLVLEGHELHPSLESAPPDDSWMPELPPAKGGFPYLSTDAGFIANVARRASQGGPLDGDGIRAALYAVYLGEGERLGLYGLEAVSPADADRIEAVLRSTWAHNESLEVARVYRRDEVLVVVWAVSETPSCWEAVNAVVARRIRRQSLSSALNSEAGRM